MYTLGIGLTIGGSMFLWGPAKQCKNMFDPTRRITTIVFLGMVCAIIGLVII